MAAAARLGWRRRVLVSLARKEKRAHASWCRRVTDVVHLARVPGQGAA